MKILYFATHKLWPLNSGNRLRDFHLAQQLAQRASVTFVEMCQPGEEPSSLPTDGLLKDLVSLKRSSSGYGIWRTLRGLKGPTPLTALNYFEPESARELQRILEKRHFDTVQLEGVHLSEYLATIQGASNPPAALVDWQNIESELMWRYAENTPSLVKQLAAQRTARLLERSEMMLLKSADGHTVASERERKKLLMERPSAQITVVPNGVDTIYFEPQVSRNRKNLDRVSTKSAVLFVGSMDYHANIDGVTWFAREVWPTITQRRPNLEFVIVGRNPSKEVLALASENIRVTGTVEDVRPFYALAIASIVPLRVGGGTRLKILEAMAAGVPVVSTSLGAEGLDAVPNTHFLLADSPAEMGEAVAQISDTSTYDRMAEAAREFAVSRYDWSIIGEKLYQAHLQIVQKK